MYIKSHLNQKYDQEVEVSDSSELLKQILGDEVPEGILRERAAAAGLLSCRWKKEKKKSVILRNISSKTSQGGLNVKPNNSRMVNIAAAPTNEPWLPHLGGDDVVVGVTLRDVGLSSRRGFFMPNVDRPTVHPDLLPHTLTETETERHIHI